MTDEKKERGFVVKDRRASAEATEGEAAASEQTPSEPALPAIDFSTFILSLSTSALCHLGQIPHPEANTPQVNLPLARQTIDILGMLQTKTSGNLSRDEDKLLQSLLYDLRMRYVEATKK